MVKRVVLASSLVILTSCGARSPLGDDAITFVGGQAGPDAGRPVPNTDSGVDGAVLVSSLALRGDNSCAVMTDGTVRCWGYNEDHRLGRTPSTQCGDGKSVAFHACVKVPTPFPGLTGMARLVLGETHACALAMDGTVRCWGNGPGVGGESAGSDDPIPVVIDPPRVIELAADLNNTCARREDSTVTCWGDNTYGQLSRASGADFQGATQLAMGHNFTCVRLADGNAQCAGLNDEGQLGNGTISGESAHPVPSTVVGVSNVVQISAGVDHACAALADGSASCWGSSRPQLVPWPVASVAGLTGVVNVAAGESFTCALRSDRSVACWGYNMEGQIGDGSNAWRDRPVPLTGLKDIVQVAASGLHACALTEARAVYCWGLNAFGEVGDGTTTNRNEPTRIDL
jgi:alpha-tubulin suppressor-like RCC1 family protein